ncbi:MAG: DUF3429 domain-containing protein [Hyphomonas sp.]
MRILGIPGVPLALMLGGLVPFAAGAGGMWALRADPALQGQVALALLAYAAMILSFHGGVRWGAEVNAHGAGIPRSRQLMLSVLGPLAAWGVLLWAMLGPAGWPVFAAAAGAHLLHGVWDADGAGLSIWMRRLRIAGTAGAVLALGAAGAAYIVR